MPVVCVGFVFVTARRKPSGLSRKAKSFDKDKWKNFLIYVEQERGEIHPVTFELIGEARKMAVKVGYQVNCVIVGGKGTKEKCGKASAVWRRQCVRI